MTAYDFGTEATACTNELFYRYGPKPRDIPRGDAQYVRETIERYLREAHAAALPNGGRDTGPSNT